MEALWIENGDLRVGVTPAYGARVVSLVAKVTGRDWIAAGPPSPNTGEDAVFGGAEGYGWDECFPTVAPWDGSQTAWGRRLRDHGDLWGRPWATLAQDATSILTAFDTPLYQFRRRLAVSDAVLIADYTVESRASVDLPFLWAQHGLLAVRPADVITLNAPESLSATYRVLEDQVAPPGPVKWPHNSVRPDLALDRIHPAKTRFAAKLYASPPDHQVQFGTQDGRLIFRWDKAMPYLGLWLNHGGWEETAPTQHIALEPTSAPHDHLGEAIVTGTAAILPKGGQIGWRVEIAHVSGQD